MTAAIETGLKTWKWFPTIAHIQQACLKVVRERQWWDARVTENLRIADRKEREELTPEQKAINVKPLTDFLADNLEEKRLSKTKIEARGERGTKTVGQLMAELERKLGSATEKWF